MTAEQQPRHAEVDVWKDEILAIAARGDEAAFARLFRHFAPRIKGFMIRAGMDAGAAEELAQETLATAWRKAALFDPDKTPTAAAWLYAIARNRRIDRFRRQRPEPDANDPAFAPDPPDAPDEAAARASEASRIARAVSELPEAQREALLLSYYEDVPHADIATRLGIPLGTVKSRLRLALARLRAALAEPSGEPS